MCRTTVFLLCIFLFTLLGTGCVQTGSSESSPTGSAKNVLRVGVTANAPPLIYKQSGRYTGLEAELARELAAFAGREVRFVELKWVDQIPSLVAGRIDIIMSGMTRTPLRQVRIDFSESYLVAGQVSLVRRAEYNRFSDGFPNLLRQNVKIGTVEGTTGDFLIEQQVARGSTKFKTPDQGVEALIDRQIDVFVYDLPMNFYFAALHEAKGLVPVPVPLTREELAWGIRKGDTELLNAANRYLEGLKQDRKLRQKVQHWIPFYKNFYNQ